MNCQEALLRLSARLDGPADDVGLEAHLAGCAECRAASGQLTRVDGALAAWLGNLELPADFDARLLARIESEAQSVRRAQAFRGDAGAAELRARSDVRRQARRASVRIVLDGLGWMVLVFIAMSWLARRIPAGGDYLPALLTGAAFAIIAGLFLLSTDRGSRWLDRRLRQTLT